MINEFLDQVDETTFLSQVLTNFSLEKIEDNNSWDINYDLLDPKNGKILITKGTKVNLKIIRELQSKIGQNLCIDSNSLIGLYIASDIIDEKTGKIYYESGYEIDEEFLEFVGFLKFLGFLKFVGFVGFVEMH